MTCVHRLICDMCNCSSRAERSAYGLLAASIRFLFLRPFASQVNQSSGGSGISLVLAAQQICAKAASQRCGKDYATRYDIDFSGARGSSPFDKCDKLRCFLIRLLSVVYSVTVTFLNWPMPRTGKTLSEMFVCDRFGDDFFLRSDLSLPCDGSARRRGWIMFASCMLAVYPIGEL